MSAYVRAVSGPEQKAVIDAAERAAAESGALRVPLSDEAKALISAVDALEAAQPSMPDGEHPESHCHRCGGPNISWAAPSPLWNEVMRGGDINADEPHHGIICPICFAVLAEEGGIAHSWQLDAQRVCVELQTVTPSGRVWNLQTWMWECPIATEEEDGS